jgi:hydroxymethylpyrimidine/phosphomethylpyrimidine kinase
MCPRLVSPMTLAWLSTHCRDVTATLTGPRRPAWSNGSSTETRTQSRTLPTTTPRALSIAGSDSGGGAGIQADLKAFARCGVHGMTAITAITAQNTVGVQALEMVAPEIVLAQIRAVAADIGVDAVKVGMLGTVEVTLAVAQALDELPPGTPVVVDPVMVAESGARLLRADAQRALAEEIMPRATVLTPNLPEARVLAAQPAGERPDPDRVQRDGGDRVEQDDRPRREVEGGGPAEAEALARAVLALGPRIVVLTGGHRACAVDLFVSGDGDGAIVEIPGERHPDGAAHGSGCTHSAALTAALALGQTPLEAARTARRLAGEAVGQGLRDIGAGAGPVDIVGLEARRSAIIERR